MQQVIYVDVLIVLNTVVTFILLLSVRQFSGCETGPARLIVASVVGGVYSLIILAPPMNLILTLLTKAAVGASITYIAFRTRKLRQMLRSLFLFLGMSLLYGGVLYAVTLTGSGFVTYQNGFGYMELSLPGIVALCVALYLVILLLRKKVFRPKTDEAVYTVELFFRERCVRIPALLDTGNNLQDVYGGREVILLSASEAEALAGVPVTDDVEAMQAAGLSVRLLPVSALSAARLLPAFTADSAVVYDDARRTVVEAPCVAVTTDDLGGERYRALIGSAFFERREGLCLKK